MLGSFELTANGCSACAPLYHHFELAGWAETTIVVRFWIIAWIPRRPGLALLDVG